MRIKKLDLLGFKSFKDRTVIQFDEGITGVVGPNGCGKSNIVDALLWVMGEMSAKHLRGSSMADVIFSGAENYAPMGFAEVSLTLENDGGPFPAQYAKYSEVMVTRRLHRSGESEYLINKEPARLRDIQEIFMDTGAGSKGFSIIEQGQIGKIVTAKPEDRRVLIEEAAGITKFKVRKRESQRKLESTDQNLVRLQDIIGEQKRQIDSLERQAQKAERYRKIKTELRDKDLWVASQTFTQAQNEVIELEAALGRAKENGASHSARVSEMEASLAAKRLELVEKERHVETVQTEHRQHLQLVQDTEFRIRELRMTIDQARRSNEMNGTVLAQYELRRTNLQREHATLTEKLEEQKATLARLESEYTEKNQTFEANSERAQTVDQELTDRRRDLLTVQSGISHLEAKIAIETARIDEEKERLNAERQILAELDAKKDELELRRRRVFQDLERERQMQLDIVNDVDTISSNLNLIRGQLDSKRSELDSTKDELNRVASRLYGLENLQTNFEGFAEGVKNIMMWQRAREESAFRPLADVVEVPAQYELAMEAALGNRLQLLLGANSDQALGAVEFLKGEKRGRSSFLSGDLQTVSDGVSADSERLRTEQGVTSLLLDVVSVPEAYKPQIAQFISDVVVVDSIRTALRLRTVYPDRTFVTVEGDTLSADGVLTGGASDSVDSGVLRRRREIKELSQSREELSGKVQLMQLTLRKIEEQEKGLTVQLENTKTSAVEKEILVAQLTKDLERAEIEWNNAIQAGDRSQKECQRREAILNEAEGRKGEYQAQFNDFTERRTRLDEVVSALSVEFDTLRLTVKDQTQDVTNLRIQVAEHRKISEGLEREQLLVGTTLEDVQNQLLRMSEESERNTVTLTEGEIQVENLDGELKRLIRENETVAEKLSTARNDYENLNAEVRSLEAERHELQRSLNDVEREIGDGQLRFEQTRMRLGYLIDQINERYMVDLRTEVDRFKDIPGDLATLTAEVEELRDKVKKLGDVNLSAIEEYDELKTRYEFLTKQHEDLLAAKDHLKKVIDRINKICSRRFRETFEQVNSRFEKVFPVLFGGGEARLILVEDPELDEPGIDIVARPPGKKLQSVSLLSGGEKALTAVSLIFSIFLVKPSPFCLLDEVDAPLDDANVARFNDLVKEMAKRSQIIVVTHNKHTMKVNNKLYGVTMQEKGVSKMVSVSLADAEKFAETAP